jgi:isochorismate synthase EntC
MSDYIFIQTNPETIIVGSGALHPSKEPDSVKKSFYLNDYFLQNKTPWIIPETVQEISINTFAETFLKNHNHSQDNIEWQHSDDQKFRKFFLKIKQSIDEGLLEKIVPVSFETGIAPPSWNNETLSILTERFMKYLSSDLYLFGFQKNGIGICGLTPELLFEQIESTITSAALAGTQASQFGDRSIKNPKDIREHQLVIDDILQQLKQFGDVKVSSTIPYWNGSLIHLRAKIQLQSQRLLHFEELVQALHPTAAVGVYPRTDNAKAILKGSDMKIPRHYFAAPFGVYDPISKKSLCIAAIRSLFWERDQIRLGAGCGVIEESIVESEIAELALKRRSIKDKITAHP